MANQGPYNYSYIFKYIIIGDMGVGKSCLLHQFTEKKVCLEFIKIYRIFLLINSLWPIVLIQLVLNLVHVLLKLTDKKSNYKYGIEINWIVKLII